MSNENAFKKVTMPSDPDIVCQDQGQGSVFTDFHAFPNSLIGSRCSFQALPQLK
jgi:hypothetical protein